VIKFCLEFEASDLRITQALLDHALQLSRKIEQTQKVPCQNWTKDIMSSISRLGTFQLLSSLGAFQSKGFSASQWVRFRKADLFEEMKGLLRKAEFSSLSVVWERHVLGLSPPPRLSLSRSTKNHPFLFLFLFLFFSFCFLFVFFLFSFCFLLIKANLFGFRFLPYCSSFLIIPLWTAIFHGFVI